jgi:GNAT superfamily N-acetyltransferase
VCAYLVGYRSRLGKVSSLGDAFVHDSEPNCLYLHDLAIGLSWRGRGLAGALIGHAKAHARSHPQANKGMALVSVNGTVPFWQAQGFTPVQPDDLSQAARDALATYDGHAVYMQMQWKDDSAVVANDAKEQK